MTENKNKFSMPRIFVQTISFSVFYITYITIIYFDNHEYLSIIKKKKNGSVIA